MVKVKGWICIWKLWNLKGFAWYAGLVRAILIAAPCFEIPYTKCRHQGRLKKSMWCKIDLASEWKLQKLPRKHSLHLNFSGAASAIGSVGARMRSHTCLLSDGCDIDCRFADASALDICACRFQFCKVKPKYHFILSVVQKFRTCQSPSQNYVCSSQTRSH